MRKLCIALVLLACSMMTGCATSGETAMEHQRRIGLTQDLQFRTFVEDLDYVLLLERNCRLTRWSTRIGY